MPSDKLQHLSDRIADHLAAIQRMFKPGTKLTLVVRRPDDDEADVVVSNDDEEGPIAAIRRRYSRDSDVFTGTAGR